MHASIIGFPLLCQLGGHQESNQCLSSVLIYSCFKSFYSTIKEIFMKSFHSVYLGLDSRMK